MKIKKVGQRIWVRASRSLGAPRCRGTILEVVTTPQQIYYTVHCDDDDDAPLTEGGEVDLDGTVLIGPPTADGFLTRAE